jgi:hypothetical protein
MAGAIFKILIREGDQEEAKVEVTVPLKLAKWGLKLLPIVESKIKAETDIDVSALQALLDEGFDELEELGQFDLVKINDGNSSIKISIEVD